MTPLPWLTRWIPTLCSRAAATTASSARGPSHEGISTRYWPPSANRLRDVGKSYASRDGSSRAFRIASVVRIARSLGGHIGPPLHGQIVGADLRVGPNHVANRMPNPQSAANAAPVIADASSDAT